MEQQGIAAVVFDMDGVLTNSEPLINAAAVAMFREHGLEVRPEDFVPFVGAGEDRYISGVAELYRFPLDLPAAKKRTYDIYLDLVKERLEAFPGAVDLVQQCRAAGLKVAVASSADRIKVEANLSKINLPIKTWDAVVSAEDVTHKKPAPDIFLAAAMKLNLPPERCVVVEDAVNGVAAAKAAGMACVAVAHTFPAERLSQADVVKANISELTPADLIFAAGLKSARTEDETAIAPPVVEPPVMSPGAVAVQPIRPWSFWETAGLGIAITAAFVLVEFLVGVIFVAVATLARANIQFGNLNNGLLWALATLAAAPVVVGLSWYFSGLRRGYSAADYLALKPVPRRQFLAWCGILVLFMIGMDTLTALLGRPIVPDVMVEAYETAGFVPLLVLAVVIAAPISEELFFRGFLFKGFMHSALGVWGTILLLSAVWAAIHVQYDFYGMALIFATGVLFGYARVHTGSTYVTIALHALMNLIAMLQVAAKVHWGD